MAKRTKKANPAETEYRAPVIFAAEAAKNADKFGIAQTVYRVVDREHCAWFEVANSFWHDSDTAKDLHVAGLVTYLPSNYFN